MAEQVWTVCAGAGLALATGLWLGVAMKPQLAVGDRPAGPQTVAGWSGTRSHGAFDDGPRFANYAGRIPPYVTGTDAERARQPIVAPSTPAAETYGVESYYVSPIDEAAAAPPPKMQEPTPAPRDAADAERLASPSLEGGAAYQDASRAEMTPPAPAADTRLAR